MKNIVHKVFINEIPLYFVNVYDAKLLSQVDGKIVSDATTDIKDLISEIEKRPASSAYYYLSDNPNSAWLLFLSYYTLIEASGGIVRNDKGEYLVIFRRGKWDLPKGKVDYDETIEEAGLREVEEECGISGLKIIEPFPTTFHAYRLKGKKVIKKTNWFRMQYEGKEKLTPQTDEDIEQVQWMNKKEIKEIFYANTYNSIKDLLSSVLS